MKATIDIPDAMYRQVKAHAALQGRAIRDVTIELYRRWLEDQGAAAGGELLDLLGAHAVEETGAVAAGDLDHGAPGELDEGGAREHGGGSGGGRRRTGPW